MNDAITKTGPANGENRACFTRAVAEVLAEEPALEAVTIDRAHQKISVATLGRTDVEKLSARKPHSFSKRRNLRPGQLHAAQRRGRLPDLRNAVVRPGA